MRRQVKSTGSGFAVQGRRIITNSHCVEYCSQVQVKRRGCDTKYIANLIALGPECDLALLTVDDESFWQDVKPIKFAPRVPSFGADAYVAGYPLGGETLCVTSGVVSRMEVTEYTNAGEELLGVQIDAAINDGNSGNT